MRLCTATHGLRLAEGYQQAYHARVEFPGNSAATPVNNGPARVGVHRFSRLGCSGNVLGGYKRTGIIASRTHHFNRVALSSSRSVKNRGDNGEHLMVLGVAVLFQSIHQCQVETFSAHVFRVVQK